MIPIIAITPSAVFVTHRPRITPVNANGTENMITNGLMNDSNWEAITMYTRMMIRTISTTRFRNMDCWSSKSPEMSVEMLFGMSVVLMMAFVAATASLRACPVATMPVTVMYLSRFFLSIVGGTLDSTTVPRSLMRTALPAGV